MGPRLKQGLPEYKTDTVGVWALKPCGTKYVEGETRNR
jgi:hypothetical protein